MDSEKQLLYRIWLNECCDNNPQQVNKLLNENGTPEEIFNTDFHKPPFSKLLRLGQRLKISRNLDGAKRILEKCDEFGIRIISIDDIDYPDRLREVYAPPQLIYVLGNAPDFNRMLGISVVGTRKGTGEGEHFSGKLGKELADSGAVVVSGMAKGMDAAAHWGALEAGGTTIAVLAGGVDIIYPRENAELYKHIQTHGCIISEQPPGTVGKGYFYNQRNRIMVGLSHGVAIVEGKVISGTAITARLAQDSNADVFAVPGNPLNPFSELPNDLIRDGSIPLMSALDIIEAYIGVYPEKLEYGIGLKGKPVIGGMRKNLKPMSWEMPKSKLENNDAEVEPKAVTAEAFEKFITEKSFSEDEEKILRVLWESGSYITFDDIADACGMETGLISSQLIILQMKKAVEQSAGGQYRLNDIGV